MRFSQKKRLGWFEVPKWTGSLGPDLLIRFKRFRQQCELLLGRPLKSRNMAEVQICITVAR